MFQMTGDYLRLFQIQTAEFKFSNETMPADSIIHSIK